jgi:hypothetical protein
MALLSVAAFQLLQTDTGTISILKLNLFYHFYKSEPPLLLKPLIVPLKETKNTHKMSVLNKHPMKSGSCPSSVSPNYSALNTGSKQHSTSHKQILSEDGLTCYLHRPVTADPNTFTIKM